MSLSSAPSVAGSPSATMNALRIIVGLLLAGWLALTVVWNIPRFDGFVFQHLKIGRWASLIPSWSFFAPLPATCDYALFYRERYDSGDLSPWHEMSFSTRRRSLLSALWNPDSRPKKALSDATAHLVRLARVQGRADDSLVISVPYLLLLNRVSQLPRGPGVTGRQFLVVRYSIVQPEPEVVIVSNVHDI